jgi:hypothetical protein
VASREARVLVGQAFETRTAQRTYIVHLRHARCSTATAKDWDAMLEASSDVVVRRRLQPGTQVGKHLVIRGVLGSGGTSVVYEALHTRLDAPVAVKVAHVSLHGDEEAEQRLEREARVCAGIEDPRVPRVYDMGELEDGRPYLVMQ